MVHIRQLWRVTKPPKQVINGQYNPVSYFIANIFVQVSFLEDREFFIDNLLVRIHLIIEMSLVDRPCATGV